MKNIAVCGSTGSIGQNTLRVCDHLSDELRPVTLAAHSNITLLGEQIEKYAPEMVAVFDPDKAGELQKKFPSLPIYSGEEGLQKVASHPSVDFVVMAVVGMSALAPTIAAIEAQKQVALANKEVLVAAGEYIRKLALRNGVQLLPIDSEHSALFQCLEGRDMSEVSRLVLTASGGPFRTLSHQQLNRVTLKDALCHPTWNMGPKVTIDSSTLMNKGLEMIEARWLFNIPAGKIKVVVHPQSVIHSMVEFVDGSILAQMNEPHMINPIQYALTYPFRRPGLFEPFDFVKNSPLEFFDPDTQKFPALTLVREALSEGESYPCFLNAANEVLVSRFLNEEISWKGISEKLKHLIETHQKVPATSLESILTVDREARAQAKDI